MKAAKNSRLSKALWLLFSAWSLAFPTSMAVAQPGGVPPAISAVNPSAGTPGSTVTLIGTNFSAVANSNVVYFGAVRAAVTDANTNSLTVNVPAGATYAPVTVTVNGLTAYSRLPFLITFPSDRVINAASFGSKIELPANYPSAVQVADLDGDGKPDLVTTENYVVYRLWVRRNISTPGNLAGGSFADPVTLDYEGGGSFAGVLAVADLDGDGKLDVIIWNGWQKRFTIFQNRSTPGTIDFAPKIHWPASAPDFSRLIAAGDLDLDGKPDLLVRAPGGFGVLRNISTGTSLAFASQVDFPLVSSHLVIADLDGDGRPDVVGPLNYILVARNVTTGPGINANSFAPIVGFGTGQGPAMSASGDLDGDGKLDLVTDNRGYGTNATISILRNLSAPGTITSNSFATNVDLAANDDAISVALGDLDGDGKPDIVASVYASSTLSVFKNLAVSGTLDTNSFAPRLDFDGGPNPNWVTIADLDGDGKPEIIANLFDAGRVTILPNRVSSPPAIAIQPKSVLATVGADVVLTAAVTGWPLDYQWTFQGTNLAGATNASLPLTNVQFANAGAYALVVTNELGSASSSNASLIVSLGAPITTAVNGRGTISSSPQTNQYLVGQTLTLTALPRTNWWRFLRWSDGNTNNPRTITIAASNNLYTAVFTNTVPLEERVFKGWEQDWGGTGEDRLSVATQTREGGYLLAGTSNSEISGNKTAPRYGGFDWWLVKLNASRALEWQQCYGGTGDEFLSVAQQTPDGGYILAGNSDSGISGNKTTAAFGGQDWWLVKVDGNGSNQWQQTFGGGPNHDELLAVIQTDDGGFLLSGSAYTGNTVGNKDTSGYGVWDLWLVKVNADGTKQWERTFGGTDEDLGSFLRPAPDGGYLLGGYSRSAPGGTKTAANFGDYDWWMSKVDQSGTAQWDRSFGGTAVDRPSAALAFEDGYVVGGFSESGATGNKTLSGFGGPADYWLVKISPAGTKMWERVFGGTGNDGLNALESSRVGGFWLGGSSASPISGNKTSPNFGTNDWWLLQTDANGNLVQQDTWGGTGDDNLTSLQQISEGYLLGGNTTSDASGNKTTDHFGGYDFWVIGLCSREAPVGTPVVLVNGQYSPSNSFIFSQTNVVQMILQTSFTNGLIYYTLDGTVPGTNSALYSVPIAHYSSATVRAIAYSVNGQTNVVADPVEIVIGAPIFRVAVQSGGSITKSPDQAAYALGQTVMLTATPARYYTFLRWSDGATANTRIVTIGGANNYTAIFTNTVALEELLFEQWQRGWGGTDNDYVRAVVACRDGGVLLAGDSSSGIDGNKTSAPLGSSDWWVIKTDAAGNEQWQRSYGTSLQDSLFAARQTADGGFVLAGELGAPGAVMKIDAAGNQQWLATNGNNPFRAIQETADGGVLAAGLIDTGTSDFNLVKFDANGVQQWARPFGGNGAQDALFLERTVDGGYILGGLDEGGGSIDGKIVKLDEAGFELASAIFGGSGTDRLRAALPLVNGDFMILGDSSSAAGFNSKTSTNFGLSDFWLMRVGTSLTNKLLEQSFGGFEGDEGWALCLDGIGGFLLGGLSQSANSGNKTMGNFGGSDWWLVRTDSAGNRMGEYVWGGTGEDILVAMTPTSDGYVLAGYSDSTNSGNKTTGRFGGDDWWVVKLVARVAPPGTPVVLVNGQYSLSNSHTITNATLALVEIQSTFTNRHIYYTLDGSAPSSNSVAYSGPITLLYSTTVRAIAYTSNYTASAEADPVMLNVTPIRFLVANTGNGTVTRSPNTNLYTLGQQVTLTATPRNANWTRFLRWSDGDTNSPRTITVGTSNVFTAIFTNTVPLEALVYKLWDKSFGGTNSDGLYSLQQTTDGGFILGGTSDSGADGNKTSPNFGSYDYWVVRLDADGNKLWDRSFGGTGDDELLGLQQTTDGGFILGGYSNSGADGNKTSPSFGSYDYWMVRLDANGNRLWDQSFGGNGDDRLSSLEPTSDGGFILAGYSASGATGNKTSPNFGMIDAWVVRLDANGNQLWDRSFGGNGNDALGSPRQTADGGFILGGISGSGANGNKTSPFFGYYDFWVVQLDMNGNKLWDQSFGGTGDDEIGSLQQTGDGGVVIGGYSNSGIDGNKTSPNFDSADYWVVRLDANGNKLWDRSFGGTLDDIPKSLQLTDDGGFILGGFSRSGADGNKTSPNFGIDDFWVVQLDANGNKLWDQSFGGSGTESLESLQLTDDGGFILGGYSNSGADGNKTSPNFGDTDFWVVRLARRETPVGTPVVLVNGQYSLSNSFVFVASNSVQVELRTTFPDGTIAYTLDGSDPNNALDFSAPVSFVITQSITIRAVAFSSGYSTNAQADLVTVLLVPAYSLAATTAGGGTVDVDPPLGPYASNAVVTLTATATNGWTFLYWAGAGSGTNPVLNVTMDRNKSVQAVFGTPLTTSVVGSGTALLSPGQGPYPYASVVRLSAVPNPGNYFRFWAGAALGNSNSPLNFIVTNANANVIARFAALSGGQFALTALVNGDGSVTKSPQLENYTNGQLVTLTATPDPGRILAGWSGDASGTQNPLAVLMNTNKIITATFSLEPTNFAPTVSIITPTNGMSFVAPTNISIQATASDSDGTVVRVEFYSQPSTTNAQPALLGTATNSQPSTNIYELTWNNAPAGNYVLTAKATDNEGATAFSSGINIQVGGLPPSAPVIVVQPSGQAVTQAGNVAFTVAANGTSPLSYQWQFNGSPIPGATAQSLLLTNVQFAGAGNYSVVVSNSAGFAVSSNAFLTVLPPQRLRDEFWVTDGPVFSLLSTNGLVYLGGAFTNLGPNTRGGALLSATAGVPDAAFPKVTGEVKATVSDGNGGWYIGGFFTAVGGIARGNLAHIQADKSVDLIWNPGADAAVNALALAGGKVFVGGQFLSISTVPRNRLAALDATTGQVVSGWDPNPDNPVDALAVANSILYVGGRFFTAIGTQARSYLAALDANTGIALPSWTANANQSVSALTILGNTLFVGGQFTSIRGVARNRIAALDAATGSVLTNWNAGTVDGTVRALAAAGGTVYAGGDFNNIGGRLRSFVAALDGVTGGALTNWIAQPDNPVWALAVAGSTVFVGGDFENIGGQPRSHIAALNSTNGNVVANWDANVTDGQVRALAAFADKVYAGGQFVRIGWLPRSRLAALDAATGAATAWNPGANDVVYALAMSGNRLYAGGAFTSAGAKPRNYIAALDAGTGTAADWDPNADDFVRALMTSGNIVYAGGDFITIGGKVRRHLAALTAGLDTNNATAWNPDANDGGSVHAVAIAGNTAYVGGAFTNIGGASREHLAALDTSINTNNATPWNPGADGLVQSLAMSGNTILAGGIFTRLGGQSRTNLAALTPDSNGATPWNPGATRSAAAAVYALVAAGDKIYVAGQFDRLGPTLRSNIAAVNISSNAPMDFHPDANNTVRALAVSGDTVYLGGDFTAIAGREVPCFAVVGSVGPPLIASQPFTQSVAAGTNVTLTITVFGEEPIFYQWRLNGGDLPGENGPSLVLDNVQLTQTGDYSVVASNRFGAVTNLVASLAVTASPVVTGQSTNLLVSAGTNITLAATVDGSPPFTYQWRLNGVNIPDATNATHTITNAQPTNSGSYRLTVANPYGAADTEIISVLVGTNTLRFEDFYTNRIVLTALSGTGSGTNAGATREAREPDHAGKRGGRSVWIAWRPSADGVATFNTSGSGFDTLLAIYTNAPGVTTNIDSLLRPAVAGDEDSGGFLTSAVTLSAVAGTEYEIAVDGFGGASGVIVLNWQLTPGPEDVPRIISQPLSQTLTNTNTASVTFSVVAVNRNGTQTGLTYQWYFQAAAIAGATNTALTLTNPGPDSVGTYRADVSIGGRTVRTAPAVLEIGPSADAVTQDKLQDLIGPTQQGSILQAFAGRRKFHDAPQLFAGTLGTQILGNFGSTRELFEPNHAGVLGGASRWFTLFAETNGTLIVDSVGSAVDTVLAVYTGTDLLNLTLIASDDNSGSDGIGARVSLRAVRGTAYLVAVDSVNAVEGEINLNWVLGVPPAITNEPANLAVIAGGNATLTVGASGTPAPGYQWFLNGALIAGATNATLTLANVQSSQAGLYSVIASNFAGSATSAEAVLTVLAGLRLITGAGGSAAFTNGSFRLVFDGVAGQSILIEASTNLLQWLRVYTNAGQGGPVEFLDTNATNHPGRFYRALLGP